MIGKLIQRGVEWATREYWKARGIAAIHEAKDAAVDVIRQTAREMRQDLLTEAMKGEVDRCVREQIAAAMNAKTLDLQSAHADYVAKYGKHATYGDPSRPIVGVTSANRAYDFATGLNSRRKAEQ
jgi:hypothetical protein